MAFNSGPYKGNRLTDENIDFRLSLLGYTAATHEPLTLVHYGGDTDQSSGMLAQKLKQALQKNKS